MKLLSSPSEPRKRLLEKFENDFAKCMENPHSNNVLQHFVEKEYGSSFTTRFICYANREFYELKEKLGFCQILQSMITYCSSEELQVMLEYVRSYPTDLLEKKYFNRCFVLLLQKLPDTELVEFYEQVEPFLCELICCKFGNVFIQEILARNIPEVTQEIQQCVINSWEHLLSKKFSRYVIIPLIKENQEIRSFIAR